MLELAVLVDIGGATFRSSRNGYWTDLSHHPPGISSECRPGRTSLEHSYKQSCCNLTGSVMECQSDYVTPRNARSVI